MIWDQNQIVGFQRLQICRVLGPLRFDMALNKGGQGHLLAQGQEFLKTPLRLSVQHEQVRGKMRDELQDEIFAFLPISAFLLGIFKTMPGGQFVNREIVNQEIGLTGGQKADVCLLLLLLEQGL